MCVVRQRTNDEIVDEDDSIQIKPSIERSWTAEGPTAQNLNDLFALSIVPNDSGDPVTSPVEVSMDVAVPDGGTFTRNY